MIRVTAYKNGIPVYSVTYDDTVKSDSEAKIGLINSMYWNYISCSEGSEKGWYMLYDYVIERV